ncbi:iron-containing alcohol dehydrogenase [Fusobacterium sp.]|uniref:iron-containing alcohol dehydrogenase n=1 Tax=Fusobacterium sp. TaxID=68766 RepID=UPI0026392E28|nr:iron-containing alcohol dehydrogenase [Fusobacterium sp.]
MENFNFKSTTRLVFGKDTHEETGKYVKEYSNKILVHYEGDGALIKKLGIYDKVIKSLEENGIEYVTLGGVVPNPRISLVYEGIKICKENGINFILAIGGGSVIDSAKAISLGTAYEGDVWDFFTGKNEPKKSMNVGVVLTIPGSGSEMSESSIINNEELSLKCVCDTEKNFPVFSILDPQVCFTIPPYLMACGVTDIMSHLMERYFSQAKHTELSDALLEAAMRTVVEFGPKIMKEPKDYNNAAQIMWSATVAHNGMIACGRIADWSSHRIEHEISAIYDITHGAGMAIVFPAWMKYVKDENIDIFVNFAVKVFGVENTTKEETALKGIEKLEEFFKSLGLKISLSEVGIGEENFEVMAEKALAGSKTLGRFKKLTKEDIVNILKTSK